MKAKIIIPQAILFILVTGVFSNCSSYYSRSFPFMDWSNPDSIFSSYDTLSRSPLDHHNYVCRFWVDQSSTLKQCIEILDTNGGFTINMHQFGYIYNKRQKPKLINTSKSIELEKDIADIIVEIDSLDLMRYKSRYHNWETDGGPMNTPMIWFRVEYRKNGLKNDFVFWKFANHDLNDDMAKYRQIEAFVYQYF